MYWNVHSSVSSNGSKLETTRCSSIVESKLWALHKVESHTATKEKEVLLCIKTWMNLTNLTLSERGKTQRIQMKLFHLYIVQEQVKLLMGLEVSFLVTFGEEQGGE